MNCVIGEFIFQLTILVARAGRLLIHEEIGSWHSTKLTTFMLYYKILNLNIIQYCSTVYKDNEGLGFLAQNQLNIYFVTSRQV